MPISTSIAAMMQNSSFIRKMFEEGAKLKMLHGVDAVCDFSIGNPDMTPPEEFQAALMEEAGRQEPRIHGYMPNAGYPYVRKNVADFASSEQGVELTAQNLLMTCGAGGALNVALRAIVNPGDEVLASAPCFVEYGFYCGNYGAELKLVPSTDTFDLDPKAFAEAVTEKTAAVIVNSPHNPTGRIYPSETLAELADVLDEASRRNGRRIYLLSDEPYRKIAYDGIEVPSVMALYPHSLVATSYSKDLSLPGERIGYLAVNPAAEDAEQLIGALTLCNRILGYVNAPGLMQRTVARLQGVSVDVGVYQAKRDKLRAILDDADFEYAEPQGTFYFWVKSPVDDELAVVDALKKELILTVPGRGFSGPGWFRISYCVDDAVIERSAEGFKTVRRKFPS
jgi:aspartate aminotransferase